MQRKMLLAMAADLRIVLMRLAAPAHAALARRKQDALFRGVRARDPDLYAPLANRLGIWQIWEMEDLAFRFLEPDRYKQIARLLEEKRVEREAFIAGAIERLQSALAASGVHAEVSGRPKHIYSIWNKMRIKRLDFAQMYDLRALRVIVDDVRDCYTALGMVHEMWTPIAEEFDDYISRPKPNGYRSLHTVVADHDGRPFEVQIRTREMHQFAEYGMAAHWRYKEAGAKGGQVSASSEYDRQLSWMRQLLAWNSEVEAGDQAPVAPAAPEPAKPATRGAGKARHAAAEPAQSDERIYVMTPQARVIELPAGATPVDFAYHPHTDLGIAAAARASMARWCRCRPGCPRGRRSRSSRPSPAVRRATGSTRSWASWPVREPAPRSACGSTPSNCSSASRRGRRWSKRNCSAWARPPSTWSSWPRTWLCPRRRPVCGGGQGRIQPPADRRAVPAARAGRRARTRGPARRQRRERRESGKSGVLVVGVGSLLTQLARCCRPAPPDAIAGFVTRGRGVSIHRRDCHSYLALAEREPERVIEVAWGETSDTFYPVDISVRAHDRSGLLRDLSEVFARLRLNVVGVNTQSRQSLAHMVFTVEVRGGESLTRALDALAEVQGVSSAVRR